MASVMPSPGLLSSSVLFFLSISDVILCSSLGFRPLYSMEGLHLQDPVSSLHLQSRKWVLSPWHFRVGDISKDYQQQYYCCPSHTEYRSRIDLDIPSISSDGVITVFAF